MTLNVSLRVPDGIVIASDSLSTINQPISQTHTVKATCDSCGNPIEIKDVPVRSIRGCGTPHASWERFGATPRAKEKDYGLSSAETGAF